MSIARSKWPGHRRHAWLTLAFLAACGADSRPAPIPPPPVEVAASASELALVPRPRSIATCPGKFAIDGATTIAVDGGEEARAIALRLARWLGISNVVPFTSDAHGIVLRLEHPAARDPSRSPPADVVEEAYSVDVAHDRAIVRAAFPAGLFFGAETLAELAGSRPIGNAPSAPLPHVVPCVRIDDAPRFRFRGMHLDVARHFFSKEVVERYVDILAFYKLNVFHWHLTDDQGFRFAIDKRPELASHDGAYSHADAREVITSARDRFVTVVPEIEMPGHARAILASHPELSCTGKPMEVPTTWGVFADILCAGNPATYDLVKDVLAEVTEVFPSELVHVGGDEVPKARWRACPKCRAKMSAEHLDAEGLQGAFLASAAKTLADHGRRVIAWDEALDGGLPADGVVMAWQGEARGEKAARAGHDVVMAPHDKVYFNMRQSRTRAEPANEGYLPWSKVLAFDPSPTHDPRILGAEGTLWTEYVTTPEGLDMLLLPRLAALAEVLWSSGPNEDFVSRFEKTRPMLDASQVGYFVDPPVGIPAKKIFLASAKIIATPPTLFPAGVVRLTTDGTEPTEASPAFAPLEVHDTTDIAVRLFVSGGRASPTVRGHFEHATLAPALAPRSFESGANYSYFEGDFTALPDFTKLTSKQRGRGAIGLDMARRPDHFALLFEGFVNAPADGVYRFVARADDGVFVDIDGSRIVLDDGAHPARDADGEAALAAGLHAIRVGYFQGTGGKELSLKCEGPSMSPGPCVVVSSP